LTELYKNGTPNCNHFIVQLLIINIKQDHDVKRWLLIIYKILPHWERKNGCNILTIIYIFVPIIYYFSKSVNIIIIINIVTE